MSLSSIVSGLAEVSNETKVVLHGMLNALCRTLHQYYVDISAKIAERFGNLILLLSNIIVSYFISCFFDNVCSLGIHFM